MKGGRRYEHDPWYDSAIPETGPGGARVRMMRAEASLHADTSGESGWNALKRDVLDNLSLPEPVGRKIFGGNARRLVPLPSERA